MAYSVSEKTIQSAAQRNHYNLLHAEESPGVHTSSWLCCSHYVSSKKSTINKIIHMAGFYSFVLVLSYILPVVCVSVRMRSGHWQATQYTMGFQGDTSSVAHMVETLFTHIYVSTLNQK